MRTTLDKLKIKPLTKEQIIISLDRLTRFKDTEAKYIRVFRDIILNNLIFPKFKKNSFDEISYEEVKNYAEQIINYSLYSLGIKNSNDFSINQKINDYENSIFNLDKNTQILLFNKIDYKAAINLLDENIPLNLKWLKYLGSEENIIHSREKYHLHFPVEKIVLTEGITEEILLPKFAKLCGYDFDKNGVHIISAGGKNQVVKYFYRLSKNLKIPVFVLFDKDAVDNLYEINYKLRDFDKVHMLKCGEFEDLLPISLIKRTINNTMKNFYDITEDMLQRDLPMVKILDEFFKYHGLSEFKKAEFAQTVKTNIQSADDASEEIKDIISAIASLKSANEQIGTYSATRRK